jgi:hypothetical protein
MIAHTAAGPAAPPRRRDVHRRFAELARELVAQLPGVPQAPPELHLAAVGATDELVSTWVLEGRTAQLPELEDMLLHIQLALLSPPFSR